MEDGEDKETEVRILGLKTPYGILFNISTQANIASAEDIVINRYYTACRSGVTIFSVMTLLKAKLSSEKTSRIITGNHV